jgi:predicted alpha/beta superfamily hydrolase
MRATKLVVILAALALAASDPSAVTAQPTAEAGPIRYLPSIAGDYFAIDSAAANRRYHVFIAYPESYGTEPERRYPVVYVLDGDSLFPMLAPQHLLLTYDEKLPEAIMVGIAYGSFDPAINWRDHDFSAPGPEAGGRRGGAPAFLRFMKAELIPQLEGKVRVDPARRVLVGQSRAGYFVLWSAYADPDLFWGRIASNPSVSPGREMLFAPPLVAPTRRDLGVALVSGTRDGSATRRDGAREWGARWEGAADAPWAVNLIEIEGGTHAASIGEAYRHAMVWLFGRDGV